MSYPTKATALKLLEGNRGHSSMLDNPEPDKIEEFPEAPKDLDDIAKEEWRTLGPMLFEGGVLNKWNLRLFKEYCRLCSLCDKEPSSQNRQQMRLYINDLGLSPVTIGKLHIKKKKDDSKFGRFLK